MSEPEPEVIITGPALVPAPANNSRSYRLRLRLQNPPSGGLIHFLPAVTVGGNTVDLFGQLLYEEILWPHNQLSCRTHTPHYWSAFKNHTYSFIEFWIHNFLVLDPFLDT